MFEQKRFNKVNIEVTNICNLKCSFCPEVIRPKGVMSIELFRRIIQEVRPITRQVCLHLMGDPLVHPELESLVQTCEAYQMPIFLVTNGVLLREKQSQILLHPSFRHICFSLHSFADNFGDKDPSQYLERIFAFTERAMIERPDLYINYRLWNLDSPMGVGTQNLDVLSRVEKRFNIQVDHNIDVRRRKHAPVRGMVSLHFDTEFTWPSLEIPELQTRGTCHGLSNHFGILIDGTVVPCCLDKEGAISLGNISKDSIIEILDRPRARAMIKGFNERKLVEDLCKRCQYIERYNPVQKQPGASPVPRPTPATRSQKRPYLDPS